MQVKLRVESQKKKGKREKFFLFIAYSVLPIAANAQCAMCRASLESTGDSKQAEAVNDGIVYLMAIPYVLVGVLGFVIYRMYYKKNK